MTWKREGKGSTEKKKKEKQNLSEIGRVSMRRSIIDTGMT